MVVGRAIALGPIGQHALHSELICYSHGIHTATPIRHTGCIQPASHKAHGVHTATLTRHTGCIQQGPQDTRGAYSHPHRSVQRILTCSSYSLGIFPLIACNDYVTDLACAIRLKEFSHAHASSPNKLIGNTRSCPDECITLM